MAGITVAGLVYRWRALSPGQETEVRRAHRVLGATVPQLAGQYGVSQRTIQRAVVRAELPRFPVSLEGWRTTFELTGEGPVQIEPWTPTSEAIA